MILHSQFLTGHKFNQEPKKQRKKKEPKNMLMKGNIISMRTYEPLYLLY